MTNDEINIAIAKACGWELTPNAWWYKAGEYLPFAPDYCNDLNAMHEAEKVLPDLRLYIKFLYLVVSDDLLNTSNEPAFATAHQRAEAFLRTLNLWTEQQ